MGPEAKTEKQLERWVESRDGIALKLTLAGARGFPDRLILLPGRRPIAVELKRETGGVVSPQQRAWVERLSKLGLPVYVLTSVQQLENVIDGQT